MTRPLSQCTTRAQVRSLIAARGYEAMNSEWQQLTPVQRGSLELVKAFDGTIATEDNDHPQI